MSPGDSDRSDFSVVTSLDVKQFELELKNHSNRSFVTQLLTGIREGFDIGYTGPELEHASCNLKSARDHPEVILQKSVNWEGWEVHLIPVPHFLTCNVIPLEYWYPRKNRENFAPFSTFLILLENQSTISFPKRTTPCTTLQ